MTTTLLASLAMALAVLALMTRPWWSNGDTMPDPREDDALAALRQQIRQLDQLQADGALGEAEHRAARTQLEQRLVAQVMAMPAPAVAPRKTLPWRAMAALAVLLAVVAGGGAWLLRAPDLPSLADAPRDGAAADAASPASAPHALGADQMAAMTERLAARLAQQPDDAHAVGGQHAKAVAAFRKAVALRADDAVLLADFADALAMTQQRRLAGEPLQLVQRALKLDPGNLKALSLAGTEAFDRKDYAAAVRLWEQLQARGGPDSVFVQQVQGGIAEARQLAGMPPAAATAVPAASAPPAATGAARVSGTVVLAPALAASARPDDTLFVFARPPEGSRMPLAILRKQVKDLPLSFTLDDSLAMSPAARLSAHERVVVGARISKDGQAAPQPGDLQGQSAVVALGTTGVKVEITGTVSR
jgi:cytochrome c-type biogenesis protein CcmH